MAEYEDKILHDVDGIAEYDNPMPMWWQSTFYVAVVFTILYIAFYALSFGPEMEGEYRAAIIEDTAQIQKYYNAHPLVPPSTEVLLAGVKDEKVLAIAKARFTKTCAPCHGNAAQGLIGPNLTDNQWINGGKVSKIFTPITRGVPAKGMPPWGRTLIPEELSSLVSYIRSLQGSNPPNAKKPEGEIVEMEPLPE